MAKLPKVAKKAKRRFRAAIALLVGLATGIGSSVIVVKGLLEDQKVEMERLVALRNRALHSAIQERGVSSNLKHTYERMIAQAQWELERYQKALESATNTLSEEQLKVTKYKQEIEALEAELKHTVSEQEAQKLQVKIDTLKEELLELKKKHNTLEEQLRKEQEERKKKIQAEIDAAKDGSGAPPKSSAQPKPAVEEATGEAGTVVAKAIEDHRRIDGMVHDKLANDFEHRRYFIRDIIRLLSMAESIEFYKGWGRKKKTTNHLVKALDQLLDYVRGNLGELTYNSTFRYFGGAKKVLKKKSNLTKEEVAAWEGDLETLAYLMQTFINRKSGNAEVGQLQQKLDAQRRELAKAQGIVVDEAADLANLNAKIEKAAIPEIERLALQLKGVTVTVDDFIKKAGAEQYHTPSGAEVKNLFVAELREVSAALTRQDLGRAIRGLQQSISALQGLPQPKKILASWQAAIMRVKRELVRIQWSHHLTLQSKLKQVYGETLGDVAAELQRIQGKRAKEELLMKRQDYFNLILAMGRVEILSKDIWFGIPKYKIGQANFKFLRRSTSLESAKAFWYDLEELKSQLNFGHGQIHQGYALGHNFDDIKKAGFHVVWRNGKIIQITWRQKLKDGGRSKGDTMSNVFVGRQDAGYNYLKTALEAYKLALEANKRQHR